MAINPLPQGLHTQYTEVLDSSPFLRRNLENEAKRAAKEEALNQYFNDLPNKINTAGVRVQDLDDPQFGGINKDIEAWRSNWLMNKDAIKKGGMPQQQHLQQYQEILRKIEQSKNRAKTELELGKARFEGKYDPDDDDMKVQAKIGRSIYDPASYKPDGVSEYSIGDLSPAIPEFDTERQKKFWEASTKGMQAGKVYDYEKKKTDTTTGQVLVPYQKVYSKDQIQSIAKNAANAAMEERSARKYYNRLLNDPESTRWQGLNKAYQSVFGDKEIVSTVEQAAAADAILRASSPIEVGEEQELNRQQAQQFKVNNIILNKGRGGDEGGFVSGNAFDELPNRILQSGGKIEDGIVYDRDGNLLKEGEIRMNFTELPASVVSPLQSVKVEFKRTRPITAKVVNGQIVSLRQEGGNEINRQFMENAQRKLDTERKGENMKFGAGGVTQPKPKENKSKKDPLGLGL
jgi:hypothetical protein